MKNIPALLSFAATAAMLASPIAAQTAAPAHVVNSFDLVVPLSYEKTAPLFGPEGERPWSGGKWDPVFLYPQPAPNRSVQDQQGAVFTVAHGNHTSVWVNTLFDVAARHFQYVYVMPEIQAVTIDVAFRSIDASHTAVHVTYARTALTPEINEHIVGLGKEDSKNGPEWQAAIEAYLKSAPTPKL